jgi:PAS domain S-box-containing protein
MNALDMRTLILNYLVSNALCAGVVMFLWLQNRRRFAGLGLWLADFIIQTIALSLIALRGIVPDWMSTAVSNVLVIGGTILLYIGLERFVGQRSIQVHNVGLLAIFTVIQVYSVFVQPSLTAHDISMSVGLLAICVQCAWLMLRRVDADLRPITKTIGFIFTVYCMVSALRIVEDIVILLGNNLFREFSLFDPFLLLASQMFVILLTFSLFLMINHRLLAEQMTNIAERQQIEVALRQSEEKFFKAFHATPDAIVLSRLGDDRVIEVNESFSRLSEYSQEEALSNPAIALELWVNPQDREQCISALWENHTIRDFEYDFRTKSGKVLKCLYSGEIIDLGGEAHMLSVVRDITERKQAEEKLRASEARYDELTRRIPVGIYVFHTCADGSMYFEYTSPQFNHLLGLEAEAVLGDANLAFAAAHPLDHDDLLRANHQAITTLTPFHWEGRFIVQGETRWIRIESEPLPLPSGDNVWNGVVSDITKRKQVEDELRSLNDRFELYLKYIPIMMYVKDADTHAIILSRQFEQMLGKPLHELLGKTNAEIWPPELAGPMTLDDARILKGDQAVTIEETFEGRHYHSVKFPIKEPDHPPLLGGYTMDITELKQTQAALQESEERMRQVTGAMRQTVWLRDTQTLEMLYVNPAYEEIWGRTCESLIAEPTSFAQAIHPDDQERVFVAIQDQYQGVFFNQEYRIIRPDGDIRWVWGRTFPIKNDAGEVYRVLAVTEDITERKQMAEALHQAKETAEAANRAKSAFLASMSHELRTPLTAILGFTELMAHDKLLTAQQRENLDIIERSGEHLLALINNVLDLSKIEAGRTEVQPEVFDLHKMILGLGEMFNLRAEQKGLTIIFDLIPGVPRIIRADAGKLRQILINLLSNAVKFTEKGGITMRVEQKAPVAESQIELQFKIQDTGIGIAASELDRVFEAFVQTESGRQSHQGTGLGLPISREYVRLMEGDLTVQSKAGQGSCFQFTIRATLPTQAEIDALIIASISPHVVGMKPQHATPVGDAYRILVIDNAKANQELLRRLLQPLGLEVETASDGQKGLEIWKAWQPHLIFLDIGLPGMDGHEITKFIRAYATTESISDSMPHCSRPVIVALTASAFEEERQTILAEGCDDFVRKPFREATIFEVLNRHLDIRFIYAEEPYAAAPLKKKVPFKVLKAQMQNLPAAWRMEMQQAILVGDVEKLNILIAQVHDHTPALAMYLAQCVYNFEYNKIQKLIALE